MARDRSGQITVTTAGTEVPGTTNGLRGFYYIRALAGNTGKIYIGNVSGAVASTTGYELSAGEEVCVYLNDLSDLFVDSSENGDKVSWLWTGVVEP